MKKIKSKLGICISNFVAIAIIFFLLAGCSGPSFTIRPDKTMEAKGFHSIVQKNNEITLTSKPWWSLGFVDSIVQLVTTVGKNVLPGVNSTTAPVPTPAPIAE